MEDCISSWLGVSEASGKKFESWREPPFIAGVVWALIIDHPPEDIEPPHFRHRFKSVLILPRLCEQGKKAVSQSRWLR